MNVFTFATDDLAKEAKAILENQAQIVVHERKDGLGQPQLCFSSSFDLDGQMAKKVLRNISWLYHEE